MGPALIALIAFAAFLSTGVVIYLYAAGPQAAERSDIKKRLQTIALRKPSEEAMPALLKDEMMSAIPALNKFLFSLPLSQRLELLIEQADVKIKVGPFALLVLALGAVGVLFGAHMGKNLFFALLIGAAMSSIPFLYLFNRRQARVKKFSEQLPDALDMAARSLRAGHSFTSALQVVSQEMAEPIAKVFRLAYEEQGYGIPIPEALNHMTRSVNSVDLRFFITAVNVQRETGGNLAEILEKLGMTIRERFKVLRQLRVYTAQGRLSGYILAALPVAMLVVMSVLNPKYIKVLFNTKTGVVMVVAAVALQVIGLLIIRKIIKIKI
jgi:tight adherence protein B